MNEESTFSWPHATALVVAAETSEQRHWAIAEVLRLVRELASQQPKVVLVDLLPGEESISSTLGMSGGQGIVDVLFRGAAFSTVARRPESETFFFLPVGTAPPPRDVLYEHAGWSKVSSRLADANAYLLPCVSVRHWLEAGPIAGFESCVVVNAAGGDVELPEGVQRLSEYRMLPRIPEPDVVEPEAEGVAPEPEAEDTEDEAEAPHVEIAAPVAERLAEEVTLEPEPETDAESLKGQRPPPQFVFPKPEVTAESVAPVDAEPESDAEFAAAAAEWQPPPTPEFEADYFLGDSAAGAAAEIGASSPSIITPGETAKGRSRRRRVIGPLFAGVAVVVLAFTLWRAWQDGFFVQELGLVEDVDQQAPAGDESLEAATGQESAQIPREAEPPAVQPAAPTEEEIEAGPAPAATVTQTSLAYSVAIASYPSLQDALDHQERIARSDLPVYVAPTPVRGALWYRVLAGMVETEAEAAELNRALVTQGLKGEASSWDVRPARLAFLFGTYPAVSDAQASVETLEGLGIPAYIVPAPPLAAGQARAHHVYAGGYRSPEEAEPLRELITGAGLDAELVERVGLTAG